MAEPIIELKDVSFSAQNLSVIRDLSFRFEEGKVTALAGPSGGGKSTLLKLAAGLLVPTGGEVYFRGKNIADMNKAQNLAFRREGAVVFQDSALWANQTLYQILELPLRVHFPEMRPADRDKRIREVTAEAGYRRDLGVRPANLSMGEQKLIAFARALLCRPRLLFLDEWTESLDDEGAGRLIGIVRQMKEVKNTVIFVSHDLRLIQNLADYVIMISNGGITIHLAGEEITRNAGMAKLMEKEIDLCDSEYVLQIR
ncbi:MAG: ATP-binding cassette domain-containing protein [Spirochaetaceae bacterium]|jgi:ABC-type multidrug transport system ATPase subunit|nr:ATP-binding cassette domain-containing protein [Spirochaetaceae bacterium]